MSVFGIISNLIMLSSAGLGLWWFIGRKAPLYFKILMLASVCYATISTYRSLYYYCYNEFYREPGITFLGFFGCFLFLLSANFGQFDSFIDDRSKQFRKYRLIALAAPAVFLVCTIILALTAKNKITTGSLILTIVGFAPVIPASYYNLKHLIFPNMDFSFTEGIRLCNLFALLVEVFEAARLFASVNGLQTAEDVCLLFVALAFLGLILSAKRGHKLWSL